ncbi:MAG: undecaprenyl-diphosphate phosphatase [Desulforhabdus sp.]|jgi:undecaprenyl-diphosphatase|nr:undecaprenyl-diphosphate phosphatase [Desulforhabdus sp.]
MSLLSALLLGIVQGVTEFLPISSSGHLVIAQHLLGWKEPAIFFDVCLHIGTFAAVLIVFHKDVWDLVRGGIRLLFERPFGSQKTGKLDVQENIFLLVVIGTVPTVLAGLFARHWLESIFHSIPAVSANLLLTGTFLWLTRYAKPLVRKPPALTRGRNALWIGLAQALALAPGISRSGITISAGLFNGLDRDWAGRYSFLLFVPAVLGALILEGSHVKMQNVEILQTVIGVFTAALSGYIALRILLRVLRNGNFFVFAPYCWLLGLFGLVWSLVERG